VILADGAAADDADFQNLPLFENEDMQL